MNLTAFLEARSADWKRLDGLLAKARGRADRLGAGGVREVGGLYRSAAADLALARRRFPGDPVVARLEDLVTRGRAVVYGAEARHGRLRSFLSRDYWRRVRERPSALAAAAALLLVPAALAALWALTDPAAAIGVVPEDFRAAVNPPRAGAGVTTAEQAAFSTQVLVNNIQVTFLAFALGITAAIGTAVVVAWNGVILGAVVGLATENGRGPEVVQFVAAHGVLELSCIVVGASAGLRTGWALVDPGHRRRGEALAIEARGAVEIILGTMPWLVLAGLVEGFVTRAGVGGLAGGLAIGVVLGGLFWALILVRGRPGGVVAGAGSRG